MVQCRAKEEITTGAMRLFPHSGVFVPATDMTQRSSLDRRLKKTPECYMRGCKANVKAFVTTRGSRSGRTAVRPPLELLVYSAFANRGLVAAAGDGTSSVGYLAPFWAVMLTDRDNQDMINMIPYDIEFKVPHPEASLVSLSYPCIT